jgi:hypothetical protein
MPRSLAGAIRKAALSKLPGDKRLPDGKRHPHQRRIPGHALQHAADVLTANLRAAATFHDLHEAVRTTIGHLHHIGELAVYDLTDRIGAYLGLEPDRVYLHAAAREGARALGIRGTAVPKSAFPRAFRQLSPGEIETCICIYKDDLRRLASAK